MTKNGKSQAGKVYQFALFGRPASGKTCLLAALAMPRIPHPQGYTCVRLPVEVARPTGNPADWPDDDRAAAAWRGAEWLDQAIQKLQRGDVPPPNPLGGVSSVFQYAFAADHRTYLIELFDYSGELIDPKNQQPESLATLLRHHMASKDGILILGEAPRPDDPPQGLTAEFDLLKQAFESLKNQARDGAAAVEFPLVLLINKWDRQGPLPHDPEAERAKLNRFLGISELGIGTTRDPESPAHLSLYDAIKNAVAPSDFQVFPVSTFGECEQVTTPEGRAFGRPTQVDPLQSFGLEDPFIWAARRSDTIDLESFEHDTRIARRLIPRVPFWPDRLLKRGRELTRRFARGTDEQRRAKAACHRRSWACWLRSLITICLSVFLLLGAEAISDGMGHSEAERIIADPTKPWPEFDRAIQWLGDYSSSPAYRHVFYRVFLSADQARERIVSVYEERDQELWAIVLNAPDLPARAAAASEYLKMYPSGKHATDAVAIVHAAENDQKRRQNAQWLQNLESEEKNVPAGPDGLAPLERIRDALDGRLPKNRLPNPEIEDAETGARRRTLRDKVVERIAAVAAQKDREAFHLAFDSAMKVGKVADAGRLLATRKPEDERRASLLAEFLKNAPVTFRREMAEFVREAKWNDAYAAIAGLRDVLKQFPEASTPGIVEVLRDVRDREAELKRQHDTFLYGKVGKSHDVESARAYLDTAPLKTMATEVRAYGAFLEKDVNPQELTLVLSKVKWGEKAQSDNDNWITVDVDGKRSIEAQGVTSAPKTETGEIGACPIHKKLDDAVRLYVDIVEIDPIWDDPHGTGTCTATVREIVEHGKDVRLPYDGGEQTAVFTIKGAPEAPNLPAWRAN
ncbi:MAG: hypothetical protein ACYC35_15235 [Pirellulales bacterium]